MKGQSAIGRAITEAADKHRAPSSYDAAAVKRLLAERDRLREALEECCRLSGADLSDGFPTWPELPEFAIQCVQTLRIDCDDTADLDEADRLRRALQFIAVGEIPGQYDHDLSEYAKDVLAGGGELREFPGASA